MSIVRNLSRAGFAALALAALAVPASAATFVFNGAGGDPFSIKSQGLTTENNTWAGTNESTWGWGYVTSIENPLTSVVQWQQDNPLFGNARLSFMLYGIADISTPPGGVNGFQVYSKGCTGGPCDGFIHGDFYLDNSTATGGTNPSFSTLTTADRTGFNQLTGVTDGTLFMSVVLRPGHILDNLSTPQDESEATLFQDVSGATLPANGNGFFFADCVAGPGCAYFGNDALLDELASVFTLNGISPTDPRGRNGWGGFINDPINGVVNAPTPGSLALFGAALVGLATIRRRAA